MKIFDQLMTEELNYCDTKKGYLGFGTYNGECVNVYIPFSRCQELMQEKTDLEKWFELEYTKYEQKFRRLRTLNLPCDNGANPYDELIKLYNDAEIKRKRIQELELLIAEAKELEKQNQIKGEMIDA